VPADINSDYDEKMKYRPTIFGKENVPEAPRNQIIITSASACCKATPIAQWYSWTTCGWIRSIIGYSGYLAREQSFVGIPCTEGADMAGEYSLHFIHHEKATHMKKGSKKLEPRLYSKHGSEPWNLSPP
jgi:hypothetical protein